MFDFVVEPKTIVVPVSLVCVLVGGYVITFRSSSLLSSPNVAKWKRALVQKRYAVRSIVNRHKKYDPSMWNERNAEILLWKVGGVIGRSGSAIISLLPYELARVGLLAYIYFRVQDSWADLCVGRTQRIAGMAWLARRLEALDALSHRNQTTPNDDDDDDDDNYDYYAQSILQPCLLPPEEYSSIEWNTMGRPINRVYVDITTNVHRFDAIYCDLSEEYQRVCLRYVKNVAALWTELEERSNEPPTADILRKSAQASIDEGVIGLASVCGATALVELVANDSNNNNNNNNKVKKAFVGYCDFEMLLNLANTIEGDVEEGTALHIELRNMKGMDPVIIWRVRYEWITTALRNFASSEAFVLHELLIQNYGLRFIVLLFTTYSLNICYKFLATKSRDNPKNTSTTKTLLKGLIQNSTQNGYRQAMKECLKEAKSLLKRYEALPNPILEASNHK